MTLRTAPSMTYQSGSRIKIIVTGDVSDDGLPPFEVERIPQPVRRLIQGSDLLVPNLEGPIRRQNAHPSTRLLDSAMLDGALRLALRMANKQRSIVCSSPSVTDLFELPPATCVTLANNHINDLGPQGVVDTIRILDEKNVARIGAGANRTAANAPRSLDVRGKPVAILNYNFVGLRRFGMFLNIHGATRSRPGAAYLPIRIISRVIDRIKAGSPEAFILLIIHAGRVLARSLEETGVDYEAFERLGAHCVIFHHSHRWFGPAGARSFFLGDFVFRQPAGIRDDRLGGFVELNVDAKDNSFEYVTHIYRFDRGYPKLESAG